MTKVSNHIATPEDVIAGVLADLRTGRFADASAHFGETFTFKDHGIGLEFKDKDRLTEFFAKVREFYPGSSLKPNRVITSGEHVIVEWTYRATTTERFYGENAIEFPVSVQGVSIVRMQEGEIIDWADYYDGLKSRRTALAAHFQEWFEL